MRKVTLIIVLLTLFTLFGVSCGEKENKSSTTKEYDISLNQDGSVKATTTKVGYDYKLTIEGSGKVIDYGSKESVPWNVLSKKITEVEVKEGVQNIGSYYFYGLSLNKIHLPSSVKTLNDSAFNEFQTVYSYASSIINNTKAQVYLYSETKPSTNGRYFFVNENNEEIIWDSYNVLFIGNSYTYRPGTTEAPMVPYLFKELAESLGIDVNVDWVVEGSYNLTSYASSTDKLGAIVDQKLKTNQYDFVILQEQSTRPINYFNQFKTAVGALVDKINANQKDCKICLYETWGAPYNVENNQCKSIEEMETNLRNAYNSVAEEYSLDVHYVGKGFTYVYNNHKDLYLYADDNRHQNLDGAYLSSLIHVGSCFKLDVRSSTLPSGVSISDGTSKILKDVAYKIVNGLI